MAVDALVPSIAKSSAAMTLTMRYKLVLLSMKKDFDNLCHPSIEKMQYIIILPHNIYT